MPAQDNYETGRLADSLYTGLSCSWPVPGGAQQRATDWPARLSIEGFDFSGQLLPGTANLEAAILQRVTQIIAACDWLGRDTSDPSRVDGLRRGWYWISMLADLCELRGLVELPVDPDWTIQRDLLSKLLEDATLAVERLAQLTAEAETLAG